MLLAVDVGNTDITFGLFRESELITRFRVTVKVPRSSDEYGELICAILQQKGYSPEDVNEVIIASVVPKIMYSFTSGIIKYLHCHPLVVGAGIKTGIRISANALWNNTANLPEIEIKCPGVSIAKDTITSMQAGLFFGTIGQSEYIIRKIKEESGFLDAKVVATGGLGKIISEHTDEIQVYDSDLTLRGLQIIYDKQKK